MSVRALPYAAVLACTLAVTAAGTATLPIDDHEAYVLQTAQEMRDRGDWIVPYFNGKPRLKKPPLSYWATATVANLMGAERVQPWHGRVPSIVGALGVVALTMLLAELLVDRRTAITAGFVAATSLGVFKYAHTARPDMLYAFWCTGVVTAFAWGARSPAPGRLPAVGLWLCVGLATLTKGPQLPLMLLAACALFARRSGWSVRRLLRTVRPVSGLALALAVALPWWIAVDRALPNGLEGTQLQGSLLTVSWRHVLDPYFFYRPLALVAPSIAVCALALGWRRWPRWDASTRLCVLLILVPAATLTFGPQHRPHYMLPTLGPLCVLLALTIHAIVDRGGARWTTRALVGLWVATIVVDVTLAPTDLLWSHDRFVVATLARRARTMLPADVPLVAFDTGAPAASYYAERIVRPIRAAARLVALVDAAPTSTLGLLVPAKRLATIPTALSVTVLAREAHPHRGDLVLARISRHDRPPA